MKKLLTLAVLALLIQGCGTVFHGTSQEIFINTTPPGATARIGSKECTTPCALEVPRSTETMTIIADGIERLYPVEHSVNWGTSVLMGIYPGLFVGALVDFSNGSAYTLKSPNIRLAAVNAKPAVVATTAAVAAAAPVSSDVDEVPKTVSQQQKNSYAIVIGIEKYRKNLPMADYAAHDAQTVTNYLVNALGYPEENVITLIDDKALKSDFEKYFEKWLFNNVEKDSTVFIYYSGHGAPEPKTGGAYLVPYDGDPTFISQTGYSINKMYDVLGKLPAKEVIVALDSCFSGAGGRSVIAKGSRPIVMNLQAESSIPNNVAVLSASAGDQTSSTYDEKGHGLFTYFLLKGIKDEDVLRTDRSIRVNDLYSYMKPQVQRIARKHYNNEQTPQLIEPKGK